MCYFCCLKQIIFMKISNILNLFKGVLMLSPKLLAVSLIIWVLSFFFGLSTGLNYANLSERTQQQLITALGIVLSKPTIVEAMKSIYSENYVVAGTVIFLNNLLASLLLIVYSMTFLLGFLFVYANGFLLGFLAGLTPLVFSPLQALGTIAFGVLEIAAYGVAMMFGFRLIISILLPRKIKKSRMGRVESLKLALKDFKKVVLVVILFLLAAAAIETFVAINIKNSRIATPDVFEQCGISFSAIAPGSPAEKSGLEPFYRIVKVDNLRIHNTTEFDDAIRRYSPGENVILESAGGKSFSVLLGAPLENTNHTVFIGISNVYTAPVLKGKCV
jgi:hypothetical protein